MNPDLLACILTIIGTGLSIIAILCVFMGFIWGVLKDIKNEIKSMHIVMNEMNLRIAKLEGRFEERGHWEPKVIAKREGE